MSSKTSYLDFLREIFLCSIVSKTAANLAIFFFSSPRSSKGPESKLHEKKKKKESRKTELSFRKASCSVRVPLKREKNNSLVRKFRDCKTEMLSIHRQSALEQHVMISV